MPSPEVPTSPARILITDDNQQNCELLEAYLSGDVDLEGNVEEATALADQIAARLRSTRTLSALARHLLALPTGDPVPPVQDARAELDRWEGAMQRLEQAG